MGEDLKQVRAKIPMHLWQVYEQYEQRTKKSFTSLLIDLLLDLEKEERERKLQEIELLKSQRLLTANAHLYPRVPQG